MASALSSALISTLKTAPQPQRRQSAPYLVGDYAVDTTLNPQDCFGGVVTNSGAAASVVVFTLPPAKSGMMLTVLCIDAGVVRLDPCDNGAATDDIFRAYGAAAGDYVGNGGAAGDNIQIICVVDGTWDVVGTPVGTWNDQ